MDATWHETDTDYPTLTLAADIGGTNSNLAVVGHRDDDLHMIVQYRFLSREIADLGEVARSVVADFRSRGGRKLDRFCICASGPVHGNRCKPTNLDWAIDGDAIADSLGLPTLVLNDFQGICFGLPLLSTEDPEQVTPLPHPGTGRTRKGEPSWAVAGAGTGLGVGYLTRTGERYLSIPSEGGHSLFAPFDEETEALAKYVAAKQGRTPEYENLLSGQGMANMFCFYRDVKSLPMTGLLAEINRVEDIDKPPLITRHTGESPECADMMRSFIRIYAKFAAQVALYFLPRSGLFVAGGIVVRHSRLFLENDHFMSAFDEHDNENMRRYLESTPVFIINNYSISLLGAANAAISLTG